ncbi:MAG: low-specificity D-threonine aldolase [Burkholderiaceae bacterium]|jgi:D-serine deaminase-like pyridoxal phosphate-dependent protein|nr:MAG: low-specificity D-threonine aldolase [Burkholderiaceae bacterium]
MSISTKPPPEARAALADAAAQRLKGQRVSAVDTPALVVDLDTMDRNLHRMAAFAKKHDLRWRPHAKLHKSVQLAKLQVQAGAIGVCVQKTSEAEALAFGGVRDIFISNEVVAHNKLARVAALAHSLAAGGGRLAIAVDSTAGVLGLAEAMAKVQEPAQSVPIDVFIEIDVGQGRCGVAPGAAALELVHEIERHRTLVFAGLQAYHGNAQHLRSVQQRRDAIAQVVESVVRTRQAIEAQGIPVGLVTGAGTGTFALEAASGVYGELQPGSFLFMDADYAQNEQDPAQPQFEQALFVKTQVISVAADHAVCDAGHKSHAIDSGLPLVHTLSGEPALRYSNGGDEHGILHAAPGSRLPALGQTLWLIPGHCDPTVNLHDRMIGVRGGLAHGKVERIIRVDARGAVT